MLAAAYAENGQFDFAIYLQKKVLDKFPDAEKYQRTMEKYKRGEPY
jgi:hypothetical protein